MESSAPKKKKKAGPVTPAAFVVFMISNSDYDQAGPGFHDLDCASTDYTEMRNLLGREGAVPKGTKFITAENLTNKEFIKVWIRFVGEVMKWTAIGLVVAIIHCTSHGLIMKGDENQNIWIVHNEPHSFTNLQELIVDLGR